MKNKKLIFITILFGLLLIGTLVIQAGWVAKIDQLNQKAFDDAVYKSLNAVVKKVEEKENFVFIKHQVETDTLLKQTKKLLKQQATQRKKFRTHTSRIPGEINVSISSDNGKETKTIVKIGKGKNSYTYEHSSVYVGAAADTSTNPMFVVTPPTPPVPPGADVISAIDDRKGEVEIIMEKMMNLRDPDSVSIQPKEIENLIAEQLKQNNIPSKFVFALLAKDPKKSYRGFPKSDTGFVWSTYKVNLYPNDLFGRDITLALMLPEGQKNSIGKELLGPISLSILFTVALLILFIYSIRMLIRHKKMLEMKNDFINHMSHEFKTPLAGISLGADMLMSKTEEMNSTQVQKIAGTIKKQSTRLTKEVNDVLQNALMEENIHKPHTLFNMVDVAKTQIDLFQPQLEQSNAKIQTNFSSEKILLRGDESQWQKVFSNLVDNSLKFSKENPEINISVIAAGNKIKIEFSDKGVGISSKDLPHIFEKFFRSNYYNQSNIQGFGLGLNFVKSVVDAHKGIIKAESELNVGTKFIIEVNAEA